MATEIERLVATLEADISDFKKGMRNATRATQDIGKDAEKTNKKFSGAFREMASSAAVIQGPLGPVAGRISAIGAAIGRVNPLVVGLGVAFAGLAFSLTQAIQAGSKYETQMFRLEAQVKATGGAAGITADEINDFARELGEATLASAEGVREAAGILLTFKSVSGETFKETLRLAQDMASVGFGSVQTASLQLAKALEDPILGLTAMRRSGVSFTESQKEMIKSLVESNQKFEAQRIILDTVSGQLGGAALGAAQGFAGIVDTLGERFTHLYEVVIINTGVLDKLGAAIKYVSDGIKGIIDFMEEGENAAKLFREQIEPNIRLFKAYGIAVDNIDPTNLEDVNRAIVAMTSRGIDLLESAPYNELADQIDRQNQAIVETEGKISELTEIYTKLGQEVPEEVVRNLNTVLVNQKAALEASVEAYKELSKTQEENTEQSEVNLKALSRIEGVMVANQSAAEKASDQLLALNALWQGGLISLEAYTEGIQKQAKAFEGMGGGGEDEEGASFREQLAAKFEALDESLLAEEERLKESYEKKIFLAEEAFQQEIANEQKKNETLIGIQAEYHNQVAELWKKRNKAEDKIDKQRWSSSIRGAQSFFGTMMNLAQGQSKGLFKIAKYGAIASATVDAYTSFTAALKNPPGPPWTYPIAAASLAQGLAQVASIKSTSFGGGGGGGGSAATPSATAAPTSTPTATPARTEDIQASTPQQVTVNLGDDDELISKRTIRRILEGLNDQIEDGAQLAGINVN